MNTVSWFKFLYLPLFFAFAGLKYLITAAIMIETGVAVSVPFCWLFCLLIRSLMGRDGTC